MKAYTEFSISCDSNQRDAILAFIQELPIDSIWEDDDIKVYIETAQITPAFIEDLQALAERFHFKYSSDEMPQRNWNEAWESAFDPVEIDCFCRIRALFHEPQEGFTYEITIQPKMAFGTGHHATTYMMIQAMSEMDILGKNVWDYGAGTGILAILAKKMGAASVIGNEIEEIAVENAIENAHLNDVEEDISFRHGTAEVVPETGFDIILANINRKVLLESMGLMKSKLAPEGQILISGILDQDESQIINAAEEAGLKLQTKWQRLDWLAMRLSH